MTVHTTDLSDGLTLSTVVVGGLSNNAYLLDDGQGHALLVDAAAEPEVLAELVEGHQVATIVTTHQHHDHIGALADMVRRTGAEPVCGTPDASSIEQQTGVACRTVWTGDELEFGQYRIGVVGLVGHTPGSITLVLRPSGAPVQLFTGDSLFPGGVGKTQSPADFTSLLDGVEHQLFDVFDDDTVVWPGHGDPTTLGAERAELPAWRARGW